MAASKSIFASSGQTFSALRSISGDKASQPVSSRLGMFSQLH